MKKIINTEPDSSSTAALFPKINMNRAQHSLSTPAYGTTGGFLSAPILRPSPSLSNHTAISTTGSSTNPEITLTSSSASTDGGLAFGQQQMMRARANAMDSSTSNQILKIGSTRNDLNDKSPIQNFFIPPTTLEKKQSSGDLQSRLKTRKIPGIVGETDDDNSEGVHRSRISHVLRQNELPFGYWNWQIFLVGFMTTQALLLMLCPGFAINLGLVGIPSTTSTTTTTATTRTPTNFPIPREFSPFPPDELELERIAMLHGKPVEASTRPPPGTAAESLVIGTSAAQYYGASLLGYVFLLWKFLHVNDKWMIRVMLFTILIHFGNILAIDFITILKYGLGSHWHKLIILMFFIRFGICIICYLYLGRLHGLASSGLGSGALRRSASYSHYYKGTPKQNFNIPIEQQQQQTSSSAFARYTTPTTTNTNDGNGKPTIRAYKDK